MLFKLNETQGEWEKRLKLWRKRFAFLPVIVGVSNGKMLWCWLSFYEVRMDHALWSIGGNLDGRFMERRRINPPTNEAPYTYSF